MLQIYCNGPYCNRGVAYGLSGEPDLAIADFTKAIALDPNLAEAYYNRGSAYGRTGRHDLALADFNKAITLKPDFAEAYHHRGCVFGAASLCAADGRLYLHGENGDVALVEASASGYHEKGRFTPADQPEHVNQTQKAWAYPVVANGRLFIRDLGTLWSYDVKAK